MTRAIPVIAFLLLTARGASSQVASRDPIAAVASTAPKVKVEARPIQLSLIDGADIQFARISTADGLSQTKVDRIVQDDQGFMWFGTQYGLNRYDGYDFKIFAHDPGDPNSISGVYIRALFKDRDGTLWVAPISSSINLTPKPRPLPGTRFRLSATSVRTVLECCGFNRARACMH